MRRPVVSVVVIARDQAWCLSDALDSVFGQSFREFELILVDDGSIDDTRATFLKARLKHPDLVSAVVSRTPAAGPAAARNLGASLARGEFLLFLDGDDALNARYLAATLAVFLSIDAPKLAVVHTDTIEFGDSSAIVENGEWDPVAMRERNRIPYCAMIRAEAFRTVGGYRAEEGMFADWGLWLSLAAAGFAGKRLPSPLFRYRRHAGQWTRSAEPIERDRLRKMVLARAGGER